MLNSSEGDRRKLQESLRTLDKYSGPIDGNLQSDPTTKAIGDWQKGHNAPVTGKLTPGEAVALNNEAARVADQAYRPVEPGGRSAGRASISADELQRRCVEGATGQDR